MLFGLYNMCVVIGSGSCSAKSEHNEHISVERGTRQDKIYLCINDGLGSVYRISFHWFLFYFIVFGNPLITGL